MGLLEPLFRWEAIETLFSDRARVQGMLDFEAALARAEARTGLIPVSAAAAIGEQCRAEHYDLEGLARAAAAAGNPAIPLIRRLSARVEEKDREAARFVHWGATSQDVMDTGLVLALRSALDRIEGDLDRLGSALASLAEAHRATLIAGRTWMQHAVPTTFGLKVAGWLDANLRHRRRLDELRARSLVLQYGGAVGHLAALGDKGLEVEAALAEELRLGRPDLSWHAHRDRLAEVGTTLGLLAGSLGKIARDLALHAQTEVAEVFEPGGEGLGGSSTMPHKRNPVASAVTLAAAARLPGLVAAMLGAMAQEDERGLGGWHAEWETLPELVGLVGGALHHVTDAIAGLRVDTARMEANLHLTRGLVFAEAVQMALAERIGRPAAQELVEAACRRAQGEGRHLQEVLSADPAVGRHLSPDVLAHLFDPRRALGAADRLIDRVLASHASKREGAGRGRLSGMPTIDVSDLRMNYEQTGPAGAPVVVLSHSLGTDLTMWDAQARALEEAFRVVRYDLRGHGRTTASPGPYAIEQLARDVVGLLDVLGVARAHFCGLSIGGMIGIWLGAHAPERVLRLVLSNTAERIGTTEGWTERIEAVRAGGLSSIAAAVTDRWFSPAFRAAAPEVVEKARARLESTTPEGYVGCCAAIRDADLRADLSFIAAPTLVIAGRNDPATTPADGRRLADAIPRARYVELDASHLSCLEAAAPFTSAAYAFLTAGGGP
jgi:3-carboxy-cis,cis-muconate cycloisomerase/3-oxoadipate enol-lactonase